MTLSGEKYQNYCETLIHALFNLLRFLNSSWVDILQVYLSGKEIFLHVTMTVSLPGRFSPRLLDELNNNLRFSLLIAQRAYNAYCQCSSNKAQEMFLY